MVNAQCLRSVHAQLRARVRLIAVAGGVPVQVYNREDGIAFSGSRKKRFIAVGIHMPGCRRSRGYRRLPIVLL